MARRLPVLLVALSFLLTLAPATAQTPEVVLRLEGHEGPIECDLTALDLLCFKTVAGNPAAAFVAGKSVRVELTAMPLEGAPGGAPHNLVVGIAGEQGHLAGIDSASDKAIAVSDTAESGKTVNLDFTVPGNGTLYFWCDVGDHEFLGMNFTADVQPAPAVEAGANDTVGNTTDNTTTSDDTAAGGDSGDAGNTSADSGADTGDETNATADPDTAPSTVKESPALPLMLVLVLGLVAVAGLRRKSRD